MTFLLPRLSPLGVELVMRTPGVSGTPWAGLREVPEEILQFVSFAASGGIRNDEAAFLIGSQLREIARVSGYPVSIDRRKQAGFDLEAAAYLAEEPLLGVPDALRDDVWAFLTCVAAPDVVVWRFRDTHPQRFNGGVRNTFQRLWIRGVTLDRGAGHQDRWGLVQALTEDAMVQIFERSAVYGHRALARAIAEVWTEEAAQWGRESMEPVMRRAIKLVRLSNEILDIPYLSGDEISKALKPVFKVARTGVENVQQPEGFGEDPRGSQPQRTQLIPGGGANRIDELKARAEPVGPSVASQAARDALSLERLGRLNGLLSPNSRAAIARIRFQRGDLTPTERHALGYLLDKLREKGVNVTLFAYLAEGSREAG
jgi:hypothetical protein